jgi:hypothetical protein
MTSREDKLKPEEIGGIFPYGKLVATPGALDLLERSGKTGAEYVLRHLRGDWGDLCDEDVEQNKCALEKGYRLMSSYNLGSTKLWIITEADRSVTTLLLPDEY